MWMFNILSTVLITPCVLVSIDTFHSLFYIPIRTRVPQMASSVSQRRAGTVLPPQLTISLTVRWYQPSIQSRMEHLYVFYAEILNSFEDMSFFFPKFHAAFQSRLICCIFLCVGLYTAFNCLFVCRIPTTSPDFHLQIVVLGGPRFHQLPHGMVPLGVLRYLSLYIENENRVTDFPPYLCAGGIVI